MGSLFPVVLASLSLSACAAMAGHADPELLDTGTRVMPTLYLTERFFIRPETPRGDTVALFTDTGDNGRLFQASIETLHWHVDVVATYPGKVIVFRPTAVPATQASRAQGHVVGDLRIHPFTSKVFGNERQLRVLLPKGYDLPANRNRRYPVLYLNDGQNLFDSTTAVLNPLEWRVDETVADLMRHGRIPPMIVVGIDNAGRQGRFREYFPWVDRYLQPPDPDPQGMKYPAFLVDEVLPFINARYRTLADAEHTGLGGSSAGGLAALRAVIDRPGVFGRLLIESPSIYLDDYHILRDATALRQWPTRIFLGVGTNESNRSTCPPDVSAPGRLADDVERLRELIIRAGVAESNVRKVVVRCARHDERAWGDRFGGAAEFLFGNARKP